MNHHYKIAAKYFVAPLLLGVVIVSWLYGRQPAQDIQEGVRLPFSVHSGQSREYAQKSERDDHASKYVDLLMVTSDAQIRREIRGEIASLKPAHETVRLLVNRYVSTNDEEARIQLLSVIGQINPTGSIDDIYVLASTVNDDPLFVSLVYCLGEANTQESKRALLKLVDDNRLTVAANAADGNNEGLSAIARMLLDTLEPADGPWLGEFFKSATPTEAQLTIIVTAAANHPSREMEQVLKDALETEASPQLLQLTQQELASMRLKLEDSAAESDKPKLKERPPLRPGEQ